MKYLSILIALCLIPFTTSVAECVDDTDASTTLDVLAPQVPAEHRESGWFEISDRACVSVDWTGEVRENPENVTLFPDEWTQKLRVPATSRALFKNQVLVHEGDQEFWLVIQEHLLQFHT